MTFGNRKTIKESMRMSKSEDMTWRDHVLTQNSHRSIFVYPSALDTVALHIVGNLAYYTRNMHPIFLCFVSPPGFGKSCLCEEICWRTGVHIVNVNASELGSEYEGIPSKRVKSAYLEASEYKVKNQKPAVLLVDDIHLGVGRSANSAADTRNVSLLESTFMEIADNPTKVAGQETERIPILATANTLSNMYDSLIRMRRMRVHEFCPSKTETRQLLDHLFKEWFSSTQLDSLWEIASKWSAAQLAELHSRFKMGILKENVFSLGTKNLLEDLIADPKVIGNPEKISFKSLRSILSKTVVDMRQEFNTREKYSG